VSHDQGKRVRANPVGIRDTPTGSKRAAIPVAWSACRDPPALAATYGSSHTAAANISRLPARRVISPGARMQVPTNLPLTSSTSRSQDPHHRTPSPPDSIATGLHRQLLRVPRQPLQHGQQLPPVIDSAYVTGLASGRVRRLDRQHDRCHRTSLNGAAGRGHTWGGWPGMDGHPPKEATMVEVGDRVLVESEKVGSVTRSGVVTALDCPVLELWRRISGSCATAWPSPGLRRGCGRGSSGRCGRVRCCSSAGSVPGRA
jgi:hypothetical protein